MPRGGFRAFVPGSPKEAELGPARVLVATPDLEEAARIVSRLVLLHAAMAPVFEPFAHGLNFELEFSLDGQAVSNASQWLGDRFIKKGLKLGKWRMADVSNLNFTVEHPEGFRMRVALAPRAGNKRRFFAYVNNHFQSAPMDPKNTEWWDGELQRHLDQTATVVQGLLAPMPRAAKKKATKTKKASKRKKKA